MSIRFLSVATRCLLSMTTIGASAAVLSATASAQERLPEIQVISNTPVQGPGIDRDKIPSMTSSVNAEDFQRSHSLNV
ncbi:MAG: TonB-dependent receptor, partial [Tardiphaga sp.]|nr:TonB-dependent receptor [Tardiphaga sp.]